MEFYLENYIHICSLIYILYNLLFIASMFRIIRSKYKLYIADITEDEYFVLNNDYDMQRFFLFITYKLYKKGILRIDYIKKDFKLKADLNIKLNKVDLEVSRIYANNFSISSFNTNIINEDILIEHYNNIQNKLLKNKLLKSNKTKIKYKFIFFVGLIIILIPGLYITLYLYKHNLLSQRIPIELFINAFIYILSIKNVCFSRLTYAGILSNSIANDKFSAYNNLFKSDNYKDDINKFFIEKYFMYFSDLNYDEEE